MPRLHPPTVHFPIAFLSFATMGDLLGLAVPKATEPANFLLALGTMTALLTAMTGLLDLANLEPQPERSALAERHLGIALAAWVCYGASLALRLSANGLLRPSPAALIFSVLGLSLLLAAAHLGGKLVYQHGAGLAPALLDSTTTNTTGDRSRHERTASDD